MLDSLKIQRRQSEIRQDLAKLTGQSELSEDETRSMEDLDNEYRTNETRYRAALIVEDEERREAGEELETRSDREWTELMAEFEVRQVALALGENRQLEGQTSEIVTEMRSKGGYQGIPIPLEALELRAGETIASGTPNPTRTMPIIDRLFPDSVAARTGAAMINVGIGELEYPVVSSQIAAGWADGETANVLGPTVFATTDKPLKPDHNLGVQVKITRKSMKQSGPALEQSIRRDLSGAIAVEMDKAAFQGTGSNGQPLGVISGAADYGISVTAVDAAASWSAIRAGVTRFMTANAVSSAGGVRALLRPELWDYLDGSLIAGTAVSEWDRLLKNIPATNLSMSANALAAPAGSPLETEGLLTTRVGGLAPFFIGLWGAVDMVRDPYTDAQSGGLRLTALATMDTTVARPSQLEVLTGLRLEAA